MRQNLLGLMVASMVSGCGVSLFSAEEVAEPEAMESQQELRELRPVARPDRVAEATLAGVLGVTVANLDRSEGGLWLKTSLVKIRQPGSIQFGAKRLNVILIPLATEAPIGSLISLDAMNAIGAPLTGSPELTVFGS